MFRQAHPSRKHSLRKQRRLVRLWAKQPTIQQRRRFRDDWKRVFKEEHHIEREFDQQYPGLVDTAIVALRQSGIASFPLSPI